MEHKEQDLGSGPLPPARATLRREGRRWVAQLVPGVQAPRTVEALATGMSGLALRKQIVALEIAAVADAVSVQRSFLVRASTRKGREHVCDQLLAHYPQARVETLRAADDPLQCGPEETLSCLELRLGAENYRPIRTWRASEEQGSDPLLGVLAALKNLPLHYRIVVQLVLADASPTWSRKAQRLAQDHPLEQERFQRQTLARVQRQTVGQELFLEGLGLIILVILLLSWLWTPLTSLIPPWMAQAASTLLTGTLPQLSSWEIVQVCLAAVVVLASLLGVGFLFALGKNLLVGRPKTRGMYDPELVRMKTERMAYRARLFLYVIGPRPRRQGAPGTDQALQAFAQRYRYITRRRVRRWRLAWIADRIHDLARNLRTRAWWKALPALVLRRLQHARRAVLACWLLLRRQQRARGVRQALLQRIVAAYRAYHLASGNFFVPRSRNAWGVRRRLAPLAPAARVLGRIGWHPAYLVPEEVASLYHLLAEPDVREIAFLERGGARTLPVPWQLTSGPGVPFGENRHQGKCTPVYFPPDILAANLLALAGTGKGKSSLLAHLARFLFADERVRRSAILLDPHGDLALNFLGLVPQARQDDVVYLNLADTLNPPGLNFLDMSDGQDRDKVVDTLLSIMKTWWGGKGDQKTWGTRLEIVLEYGLLTLCEVNRARCLADPQNGPDQQCTILSLVPLLLRPFYRKALLGEIKYDTDIWSWWKEYFERQDDQVDSAASVVTRISKFRAFRRIRRLVGQPRSSISLSDIVTNGRLFIVNMASGIVGGDTATLLGSILLGLLHTCIAEQAREQVQNRTPVYLFLDEMQKFLGIDLDALMAEVRKYGGTFALATQSFGFLDARDASLSHTIRANTDQLFAFDMSGQDAESMAREIGNGVEAQDILQLDAYACYAGLFSALAHLPPFSVHLLPPPEGDPALVAALEEKSARVYGCPAAVVDDLLRLQDRAVKKASPPAGAEEDDGLSPDFDAIERAARARHEPDGEDGGMP